VRDRKWWIDIVSEYFEILDSTTYTIGNLNTRFILRPK